VRTRPAYSPCKIFYDGAVDLQPGHYLVTPGGSGYLVQTTRRNRNKPYRQHLGCLRWPVGEIPKGAKVHPLHWYARKKKTARRLADVPRGT
jgi:hypothetical protein